MQLNWPPFCGPTPAVRRQTRSTCDSTIIVAVNVRIVSIITAVVIRRIRIVIRSIWSAAIRPDHNSGDDLPAFWAYPYGRHCALVIVVMQSIASFAIHMLNIISCSYCVTTTLLRIQLITMRVAWLEWIPNGVSRVHIFEIDKLTIRNIPINVRSHHQRLVSASCASFEMHDSTRQREQHLLRRCRCPRIAKCCRLSNHARLLSERYNAR